jgi:TetR/AcrR family fatty acid metabolism transcriptional regulator
VRLRSAVCADKILHAAGHLFGTRRFHEVRMEDIAAEARVGKGTLYRYFKDKDELYLKLVGRASETFSGRIREAVARAAGARAGLVALTRTVLAFFDEQPHIMELIQRAELLRGLGSGHPWHGAREELFRLTTDLLAEGVCRGEFAVADPELAMMMLLGGLRTVLRFGKRPRPADLAEQAVDTLLGAGGAVDAGRPKADSLA